MVVTAIVAKRSQTLLRRPAEGARRAERPRRGDVHAATRSSRRSAARHESVAQFDAINDRLYDAGWRAQFISGMIMPLHDLRRQHRLCLRQQSSAASWSRSGRISIGDVQAFIQYARQFSHADHADWRSIANIIQLDDRLGRARLRAAGRAGRSAGRRRDAVASGRAAAATCASSTCTFGYKPDAPLIEDMNIDVQPGQTIAIVGPTGAGKTTLVNLLMRFYDVNGGTITVDGVDIRELKRGDLRSMFGMVLQDTWLFNGTIRDNIAYGREDATEEEIVAGGQGRARRSLHPHAARRLRHGPQRGSVQHLAGPEAAADDRPRVPGRPGDPDPRRGHEQRRHPHRGADPAGDGRR